MVAHSRAELDHGLEADAPVDRAFLEIIELEVVLVPHLELELRTPNAETVGYALEGRVEQQCVTSRPIAHGHVRLHPKRPKTRGYKSIRKTIDAALRAL
jgi:hypothetical protein